MAAWQLARSALEQDEAARGASLVQGVALLRVDEAEEMEQ